MTFETTDSNDDLAPDLALASSADVARYIEQMSIEMLHLAKSKRLDLLVYFLNMAIMEAHEQAMSGRAGNDKRGTADSD